MIRWDAPDKLRGAAVYGSDLSADRMLWGALVPSPVAHGRVISVDLERARRLPGVVSVLGAEAFRALFPKGGDPERPIFPAETVVYRGQPIAAVAAESRSAAQAAARAVTVQVEELPAVTDLDEAYPQWPGGPVPAGLSVVARVHAAHGDVAGEFARADLVHSDTYRTSGVEQVPLEPHACLAFTDGDRFRVQTSTQSPFGIREDAASLLGVPEESLVVEPAWVGGGFGGKNSALLEPYAVALAAASRRPVKLVLDYREEFRLARSTLPARFHLETAVRGGEIRARRGQLLLDSGASLPGRDFATGYALGFLLGPYRGDIFELEGIAVRTNKPPFGPHRAPLTPQVVFAADGHIDSLARRLHADPVAFRRRHAWKAGSRTPLGQVVGPFGLDRALARAQGTIRRWRAEGDRHHGFGVGVGYWSTGTGAGGEARLLLGPDGLTVFQAEAEIGSGSVIGGLAAVAERTLGIPRDAVHVRSLPTDRSPFDSGVFGSRTVGALGRAVGSAAESLARELGRRLGARGAARVERGRAGRLQAVAGRRRRPLAALLTSAERAAGGIEASGKHYGRAGTLAEGRVVQGEFYPYTDFTAAVHACEVEVDRETGQLRVVRYAAFHDVGTVIDPELARASVEGGVVMGLGTALTEETAWAPDGRLLNGGLADYRIPAMADCPPIQVELIPGFRGAGPFGAKGLGEPPIIPVPAAIANAVEDATGARLRELPLTAERVARALKLL